MTKRFMVALVCLVLPLAGCSGGGDLPTAPEVDPSQIDNAPPAEAPKAKVEGKDVGSQGPEMDQGAL